MVFLKHSGVMTGNEEWQIVLYMLNSAVSKSTKNSRLLEMKLLKL
jgi:hypothetical protein